MPDVEIDLKETAPTPWLRGLQWVISPTRSIARLPFMLTLVSSYRAIVIWNCAFYLVALLGFALLTFRGETRWLCWLVGALSWSRVNELLIAFGFDAVARRDGNRPRRLKDVGSTRRIGLLACAYVETIAQFGVMHLAVAGIAGRAAYKGGLQGWADALYFSAITITSTGFGDIVPADRVARLVTAEEAVLGMIFVALTLSAYLTQHQQDRSA